MTIFSDNITVTFNSIIQRILREAHAAYQKYGYDLHVTSGNSGEHGANSLHYHNRALDLRIKHLKPEHVSLILADTQTALGKAYQVVLEKDHFHVEFDPKP